MKSVILVALAFVALAVAAPVDEPEATLRYAFDQQPEGGFNLVFETAGGISRQEEGQLKEVLDEENKPHKVVVVRGSYSYTNPEGKLESVSYVADETGFHADGESIPKAPAARR